MSKGRGGEDEKESKDEYYGVGVGESGVGGFHVYSPVSLSDPVGEGMGGGDPFGLPPVDCIQPPHTHSWKEDEKEEKEEGGSGEGGGEGEEKEGGGGGGDEEGGGGLSTTAKEGATTSRQMFLAGCSCPLCKGKDKDKDKDKEKDKDKGTFLPPPPPPLPTKTTRTVRFEYSECREYKEAYGQTSSRTPIPIPTHTPMQQTKTDKMQEGAGGNKRLGPVCAGGNKGPGPAHYSFVNRSPGISIVHTVDMDKPFTIQRGAPFDTHPLTQHIL